MKTPRKETLRRIVEEFPTLPWGDAELGELVAPRYGIITGFGAMLRDVEALAKRDLGGIGPAAAMRRPAKD